MNPVKIGKILVLGLLFSLAAKAEPRFTVTAVPNPVHEDDNVQLRMEISTENAEKVSRPTFDAEGFDSMGSPSISTSVSSQYINGKITVSQRSVFTFILLPKEKGSHKISNIQVNVGNTALRATDVLVNVLPGSGGGGNSQAQQQPRQLTPPGFFSFGDEDEDEEGANPARPTQQSPSARKDSGSHPSQLNSDFTVHINLDKKVAYPGEPIVVEFYIYDRGGLQNIEISKWPSFPGFYKEDLEIVSRFQFEPAYVQNQRMRKALIARFAIYPYKPGKFALDRLVVNGQVIARIMRQDDDDPFAAFFGSFGQARNASHASEEETIEVLPLPETGKPANFGGAVGKFTMALTADKTQAPANSPINLTLNIEGRGNFHAIGEPKLPLPPDFELYESTTSAKASAPMGSRRALENKKSFQYLILPRKEGKFTIPPTQFSFYDPEKKSYQTLSTQPLSLEITPDQSTHYTNANLGQNNAASASPAPESKKDLLYLKPIEKILGTKEDVLLLAIRGITAVLGALCAVIALLLVRRKFSPAELLEKFGNSNKKRIQQLLSQVKEAKTDRAQHYASLEKALHGILGAAFGKASMGMTFEEIEAEWKTKKLPANTLFAVKSFLEKCDRERFAGSKFEQLEEKAAVANLEELRKIASDLKVI